MTPFPWIMIIIVVLIVVIAITAIIISKPTREEYKKTGKHPKGHYIGIGIAIGIPLGMPIGIAMGNISIGPAIGIALGIAIGTAMEKQHADELRELTPQEKHAKKTGTLIAIGLLSLGMIAGIIMYFLTSR